MTDSESRKLMPYDTEEMMREQFHRLCSKTASFEFCPISTRPRDSSDKRRLQWLNMDKEQKTIGVLDPAELASRTLRDMSLIETAVVVLKNMHAWDARWLRNLVMLHLPVLAIRQVLINQCPSSMPRLADVLFPLPIAGDATKFETVLQPKPLGPHAFHREFAYREPDGVQPIRFAPPPPHPTAAAASTRTSRREAKSRSSSSSSAGSGVGIKQEDSQDPIMDTPLSSRNSVHFVLHVTAPIDAAKPVCVYSGDIRRCGVSENHPSHEHVGPALEGIPIMYLAAGETVHAEMIATVGYGYQHAAFFPITELGPTPLPQVRLRRPLVGMDAISLVRTCPRQVFSLTKAQGGDQPLLAKSEASHILVHHQERKTMIGDIEDLKLGVRVAQPERCLASGCNKCQQAFLPFNHKKNADGTALVIDKAVELTDAVDDATGLTTYQLVLETNGRGGMSVREMWDFAWSQWLKETREYEAQDRAAAAAAATVKPEPARPM